MIFLSKALNSFLDKNLNRIYELDFIIFPNNPYYVFLVKEINTEKNYIVLQDSYDKLYRNSITMFSKKLSLLNADLISGFLSDSSCVFLKNNIQCVRKDLRQKIEDGLIAVSM